MARRVPPAHGGAQPPGWPEVPPHSWPWLLPAWPKALPRLPPPRLPALLPARRPALLLLGYRWPAAAAFRRLLVAVCRQSAGCTLRVRGCARHGLLLTLDAREVRCPTRFVSHAPPPPSYWCNLGFLCLVATLTASTAGIWNFERTLA